MHGLNKNQSRELYTIFLTVEQSSTPIGTSGWVILGIHCASICSSSVSFSRSSSPALMFGCKLDESLIQEIKKGNIDRRSVGRNVVCTRGQFISNGSMNSSRRSHSGTYPSLREERILFVITMRLMSSYYKSTLMNSPRHHSFWKKWCSTGWP